MYKDILININFLVGLVLFALLIFNNICPVYVGFFFFFSLIFMYLIFYEIDKESETINRDLKIILFINILFMIWGLIILFEDCMKKYIFQMIYIMISVVIYLVLSFIIINRLKKEKEKEKEIEIGILDNYHLESFI